MLLIHLPLNKEGNFYNYGLADVTVTNNGATYDANGKIGGTYECYSGYLKTNIKCSDLFQDGDSFSYSLWIKIIEIPNGTTTDEKRGGCFGCNLYNGGGFGILLYNNGAVNAYICNNTNANLTTFIIPNLNEWNHYTFTYNKINKQASIYINGNLIKNYTLPFVWGTNNSQFWIGKNALGGWTTDTHLCINDVRIYNHCLSPKEVNEIAKGLVLHYPMNDLYVTTTVYDCSGYCNNGTVTGSLQVVDDSPRYKKSSRFGTYLNPYVEINPSFLPSISNGTVSWWFKPITNSNHLLLTGDNGGYLAAGNYSTNLYHNNAGSPVLYVDGIRGNSPYKDGWHHYCLTGVNISSWTKLYINNYSSGWPTNGLISDFRIYSTALSEDDIKELYNTSAIINNNNTLEAYEFSNADTYSINKSGVLESSEFIEQDGDVLINNTEQVFATEFTEI